MADSEARKILAEIWALNGFRESPESVGLNRSQGFPVAYEQQGSDRYPQRGVFNQLLCELFQAFDEKIRYNFPVWDSRINYRGSAQEGYAFVIGNNGKLYVALQPSGPRFGNSTDPVLPNQSIWQEY